MLFYTHLIIPWEQHDEQVSSLATRTPQTLDRSQEEAAEVIEEMVTPIAVKLQ